MNAPDVTVLVVDDQEPFREALRHVIASAGGFVLVGEATSGEAATLAVAALSPQLVLMDMVMPGMGGIAAARRILDRRSPPVVVLTSVDDPSLDPRALALGDGVACVRKQDLLPSRLTELWVGGGR